MVLRGAQNMLSQQTKDIVKATIPALEMKGIEITTIFYKHLFEDYPQLLNIFNQTNQKERSPTNRISKYRACSS